MTTPQEVATQTIGLLMAMIENDEVMDFLHTVKAPDIEVREVAIGTDVTYGDLVVTLMTNFNEVYRQGESK